MAFQYEMYDNRAGTSAIAALMQQAAQQRAQNIRQDAALVAARPSLGATIAAGLGNVVNNMTAGYWHDKDVAYTRALAEAKEKREREAAQALSAYRGKQGEKIDADISKLKSEAQEKLDAKERAKAIGLRMKLFQAEESASKNPPWAALWDDLYSIDAEQGPKAFKAFREDTSRKLQATNPEWNITDMNTAEIVTPGVAKPDEKTATPPQIGTFGWHLQQIADKEFNKDVKAIPTPRVLQEKQKWEQQERQDPNPVLTPSVFVGDEGYLVQGNHNNRTGEYLYPDGRAAKQPQKAPSESEEREARQVAALLPQLRRMAALSKKINQFDGFYATIKGAAEQQMAKVNYAADVQEYNSIKASYSPLVGRAMFGRVGDLAAQENLDNQKVWPDATDSEEVAQRKIRNIYEAVRNRIEMQPPGVFRPRLEPWAGGLDENAPGASQNRPPAPAATPATNAPRSIPGYEGLYIEVGRDASGAPQMKRVQ